MPIEGDGYNPFRNLNGQMIVNISKPRPGVTEPREVTRVFIPGEMDSAISFIEERFYSGKLKLSFDGCFIYHRPYLFDFPAPAARGGLKVEALSKLCRIAVSALDPWNGADPSLDSPGLKRPIGWSEEYMQGLATMPTPRLWVPDVHAALAMVSVTDMTALLPRRLVLAGFQRGDLAEADLGHAQTPARIAAVSLKTGDNTPVRWLTQVAVGHHERIARQADGRAKAIRLLATAIPTAYRILSGPSNFGELIDRSMQFEERWLHGASQRRDPVSDGNGEPDLTRCAKIFIALQAPQGLCQGFFGLCHREYV